MSIKVRYIGLDVHKETIVVAVADAGRGEAKAWKTLPYDLPRLIKAIALLADGAEVEVCYEAGPTGYGIQRALQKAGYPCHVVAPSLIPVKSGNRVKTDRRDAAKLAHFLRSGDLTAITVPSEERYAISNAVATMPNGPNGSRVNNWASFCFAMICVIQRESTGHKNISLGYVAYT